jgi:molecular chaperone GrpE (heat shock protein)
MLSELEDKVDRTQASLDNINKRLKTTLEKVIVRNVSCGCD